MRALSCPDVPPDPGTGTLPTKFFQAEVELTKIIQDALSFRYHTVPKEGKQADALLKSSSNREDGLPELTRFTRQWRLQFPIPPSVGLPLEELMTSPWCWPAKIMQADRHSLTMILYPAAGREIILAFIEGALHHFNPKRKRGTKMAWRMASRKRGVRSDVRIMPSAGRGRLRVTIALPAHAQDVRAAVADELPRSVASWRSREDYETVFRVIDSLKTGSQESEAYARPFKVRDCKRAFNSLVRRFGLPR